MEEDKVMEISEGAVLLNSSRLKSVVWNHFDRFKKGDSCVAICRHCKKKLSGSSTSGTSHLRNHLIRCRRRSSNDITQLLTKGKKKEATLATANFSYDHDQRKVEAVTVVGTPYEPVYARDGITSLGSSNLDHKHSRLDLARMIILHGYPLAMVEDMGFKIFIRNLQPFFNLVTFDRLEADCKDIYQKEKQKVYEELDKLPGRISLSADTLTGDGGSMYLSLTAHYIDDTWQLRKKILNFLTIDPSQTEDMLPEVIMTSLRAWDVERKLFSVTFDNVPVHDSTIHRIRDQLCQHRFLLCDGQLFDMRCASDIVKLMVRDTLDTSSEIIHKIRETIRYINSSQATQAKFNELVQVVGVNSQKCLCIDNPSRWNTTYIMLETALEYKDAFPLLQEQDPAYSTCPSGTEWERAGAVSGFLKHFLEVTNIFAGSKNPTANTYFPDVCDVHLQLIEWCQITDEFLSNLALKLKSRFDEYWKKCSLALAIAAILDPRFKMKLVEYYYPQIYGSTASDCMNIVSDCMKALYNGHAIYSPLASHLQSTNSQVADNGGVVATIDSKDKLTGFDRFLHETSQSENLKSDLDKYLEEPLFPRNIDFNILNWWKVHTPRYPILSMMARNILGIPMSKVQLEYAFNTGNRVLSHYRSSLNSDILQVVVCAQDWISKEVEDPRSSLSSPPLALCYDAH